MTVDILILSNGPGEITTWVRPVVKALRQNWEKSPDKLRISVILSPCPNATGKEAAIARSYPEVDRVQSSEHFFSTLLWGKTAENWDWREKGIVVFLGGDQAFPVIIGKRLGYQIVTYAEWEARWYRWVDRFGVRNEGVKAKVPNAYQDKCEVIGDLMVDIPNLMPKIDLNHPVIGLMPGSKAHKLVQGVPFLLAIAHQIHHQHPHAQFILPVAPTIDPERLAPYTDPQKNPLADKMGGIRATLEEEEGTRFLSVNQATKIKLITDFPAHQALSHCAIVLTTVGANTAELGALAVPMIVLLPTQQLDAMKSWDGIGGIVSRLPGIGSMMAKMINTMVIKQGKLFAWPNIWAKEEIVPELVGKLTPEGVAQKVLDYLAHPEQLQQMRDRLGEVRGELGASSRFAALIRSLAQLT